MQNDRPTIRFGRFRLLPAKRELVRDGASVRLGSRAFDLLFYLVEKAGEVVSKDALMRAVWPERVVEENNLTVHMTALRRALGDGIEGQSIVRTIPGRGYVFTAEILSGETNDDPAPTPAPIPHQDPPRRGLGPLVLPPATVRLIGRAGALTELHALARIVRLITLVGPGGVGKTSLALQLAADLEPDFPDGIAFVDFSIVSDPARVPEAVAAALGGGAGANTAAERLNASLQDRKVLLLLDNCEHLIEPIARLVTDILAVARQVLVLATSREGLFLNAERIFRVLPLPFPGDPARTDRASACWRRCANTPWRSGSRLAKLT